VLKKANNFYFVKRKRKVQELQEAVDVEDTKCKQVTYGASRLAINCS